MENILCSSTISSSFWYCSISCSYYPISIASIHFLVIHFLVPEKSSCFNPFSCTEPQLYWILYTWRFHTSIAPFGRQLHSSICTEMEITLSQATRAIDSVMNVDNSIDALLALSSQESEASLPGMNTCSMQIHSLTLYSPFSVHITRSSNTTTSKRADFIPIAQFRSWKEALALVKKSWTLLLERKAIK